MQASERPTIGALVEQLGRDVRQVVEAERTLLEVDVRDRIRALGDAAIFIGLTVSLVAVGTMALAVSLYLLLDAWLDRPPLSAALVGGGALTLAGWSAVRARREIEKP